MSGEVFYGQTVCRSEGSRTADSWNFFSFLVIPVFVGFLKIIFCPEKENGCFSRSVFVKKWRKNLTNAHIKNVTKLIHSPGNTK